MEINPMSLNAVKELISWAAAEGWNPGLDDAEAFHAADPDGFLVAREGDKSVAGISVVKYGDQQGFLGLYICHPDYRGKGIGITLWEAGMRYLEGFTVGLDGVVEQQANYQKSGFEYAYRNIRFCGTADKAKGQAQEISTDATPVTICRHLEETDLPAILRLDTAVHGFDRRGLLDHWLTTTENRATLICIEEGEIAGFGTIRRCLQGFKVGPLITSDTNVAKALLKAMVEATDADEITLDVPEPNKAAMDLANRVGLTPVFETARMYRGNPPAYKLDRLFGVTTFELG